jgi:hypothetical protein
MEEVLSIDPGRQSSSIEVPPPPHSLSFFLFLLILSSPTFLSILGHRQLPPSQKKEKKITVVYSLLLGLYSNLGLELS